MATTKKSETAKPSEADALEAILNKLGAMEERISVMEKTSSEPPKLKVVSDRANPYKDQKVVQDHLFAEAPNLLNEGDVVRLKDNTEKALTIMRNIDKLRPDVQEDVRAKGILGYVEDYKYTSAPTADPKFRVKFPGIGTDGVRMSEMEIIERV